MAVPRIIGTIAAHTEDRLLIWDMCQKIGKGLAIAICVCRYLNRADIQGFRVDTDMNLGTSINFSTFWRYFDSLRLTGGGDASGWLVWTIGASEAAFGSWRSAGGVGSDHRLSRRFARCWWLSWLRFPGCDLGAPTPDANTIRLFREKLTEGGALDMLFAQFDRQLKERGYLAMGGQIVDAALVAAPRQRNTAPVAARPARHGSNGRAGSAASTAGSPEASRCSGAPPGPTPPNRRSAQITGLMEVPELLPA
jgi:hypothetical protein